MKDEWKLTFDCMRFEFNTLAKQTFTQTGDGAFTAECVDILLADPTVTTITIARIEQVAALSVEAQVKG